MTRRAFTVEFEGDFEDATEASDIATIIDIALDHAGISNVVDLRGNEGCRVFEIKIEEAS